MVRRRTVWDTVGGFGMLCDGWVLKVESRVGYGGLLKLEMEVSDKLRRDGGYPYRDSLTQVNVLRVENEEGAKKCVTSRGRRSGGTSSMKQILTAVKSYKLS